MAKSKLPLLLGLGGLGVAAVLLTGKSAEAAPPPAVLPATGSGGGTGTTVSKNGHAWKLVPVGTETDVFAPAGSWGPHAELRVLRYVTKSKLLSGAAAGVPQAVMDAAIKDLGVKMPAGPVVAPAPSAPSAPVGSTMPTSLQREVIDAMNKCSAAKPTAADIQHATELASRLQQMGFPEYAAQLRACATEGSKRVPAVPPAVTIPGVPPELQAIITRALQLERDPARLEALVAELKKLPASAERDMMIGALQALILQIRTAQAVSTAATEIETAMTPTGARLLKLASPNMRGEDVRSWQNVLRADGAAITADGLFGPATKTATQVWQAKRRLSPDGIVGPATRAKIGTPPSGSVPAASSQQPVASGPRLLKLVSPNMRGEDVRLWQEVLRKSGYSAVVSDGVFGPGTSAATKDWQSKRGLEADGIVGPATLAKVGSSPTAPLAVPASASPKPDPAPKSSLEVAAAAMVTHLLALQAKHGVSGSKGRQDMTLVKRFQSAVGGVADGYPGVNTMIAAARAGQGKLPKVMYWPKNGTKAVDLKKYREALAQIAVNARNVGLSDLAASILASAATEDGSGMLK